MANFFGNSLPNPFNGTAGSDNMFGQGGSDTLNGNGGNDRLNGGVGNDTLNGGIGTGIDTADYSTGNFAGFNFQGALPDIGVQVNLSLTGKQNTVGAGSDTLISIENLIGTNFNDRLTGNSASNVLLGLAGQDSLSGGSGDDWLNGGTGNDLLTGGTGSDTADYSNILISETIYTGATSGVTVNLGLTGPQSTGGAGVDTLSQIENLKGTNFNDHLTGNNANNVLSGENGNDTLTGGNGNDTLHGGGNNDRLFGGNGNDLLTGGSGNDLLNGGAGSDTASYATATAGVTVGVGDFGEGPQDTGGAGIDTLVNIENLTGSKFNDELLVSFIENSTVNGGDGNDKLIVDHGNFTLNGGAGNDQLFAESSHGTFNGGTGNDQLIAEFSSGTFNGEDGHDVMSVFDADSSILNGGAGNDKMDASDADSAVMNGGTGNDQLTADFSEGILLNGGAGNDVLRIVDPKFGDEAKMTGGAGTDTFIFDPGGANFSQIIITDFAGSGSANGEQINLKEIDAIEGGTDQAFTYIGSAAFTAAGQLRYAGGILQGNTVGGTGAEFEIQLVGAPTLFVQAGNPASDILL